MYCLLLSVITGRSCELLLDPYHGKVHQTGRYFGDRAIYTCGVGYQIIGPEERVCQATGLWSSQEPYCKKKGEHHSLLCPKFVVFVKSSSNVASKVLVQDSGSAALPPTILYTTFVQSGSSQIGCLVDNGSTDDYILNKTARKLKLIGQPIELITEGFGGALTRVHTNVYQVPLNRKDGK